MKSIQISKYDKVLAGTVRLPASKSISNRLLIIRHLCGAEGLPEGLSEADDTLMLQRLLSQISRSSGAEKVTELDCGNAGTVLRFLTALLSITPGKWMLTGSERMKQRPVGVLADALKTLGAAIDYLAKPGYPPLLIRGKTLTGKEVTIDPGISSQFTSALLMIAPVLTDGLTIRFRGKQVSAPYIGMTLRLMEHHGASVKYGQSCIKVKPGKYRPVPVDVEADWSAAAFWYQAAVFATEVDLVLEGLQQESLQGDAVLPALFSNFGIETEFLPFGIRLTKSPKKLDGFYYDFTDHPDLAQSVIATCAGLGIKGVFEGVKSLQIKETDRLLAMKSEIEKMGFKVLVTGRSAANASFEMRPVKPLYPSGISFESYGDHRMAMALAPLAMITGQLKIRNPDVVVKSYPDFWEQLRAVGFFIQP